MTGALLDRFLASVGAEQERPAIAALSSLRLYLVLHAALELLHYALRWDPVNAYFTFLLSAGLGLSLLLLLRPGRKRVASGLAATLVLIAMIRLFPGVSNHFFLLFVCLVLLGFLELEDPAEGALALQAVRIVTAVVLFWTGFQKVLYGTYFQGQFFAWTIATEERFAHVLGPLLAPGEVERLQALAARPFSGPFVLEQPLLLIVSNLVYGFEMVAPVLLLFPRTRRVALPLSLAFIVAIETGARELMFGMVFVNLLLVFARENWVRRTLPVWLVLHGLLLLVRLGVLPEWRFN